MASDKRNFSDFVNFPGKIKDNRYQFPVLHHIDGRNNHRAWKIQIRLIKEFSRKKRYSYGWNVNADVEVPFKHQYLTEELPDGILSQMWAEVGVVGGKTTIHPPSFPKKKNAGKADERSMLQSAMIEARAKYLKKIEKGGRSETEFKQGTVHDGMYYPMLLRKFDDEKKHITFPAYIQPKLDGTRIVGYLTKPPSKDPTYNDVKFYTRSKKIYTGFHHIKRKLLPALLFMFDSKNNESFYVDGEFYRHGKSLQEINGMVRNEEDTYVIKPDGVQLHLFDGFYPSKLNKTTKERLTDLEKLFSHIPSRWVRKVKTELIASEDKLLEKYEYFVQKKYEGAVVRNINGNYLAHPTLNNSILRSRDALKLKKKYSLETPVVGFTQGTKGKDIGAILWICQFKDKTLTLQPKKMTYKKRYALFADARKNFTKKYKDRLLTIEHEGLSDDGIPLRAKAAGFRNMD